MNNTYLAIDFGGGSGRVIAGQITGGQLHLDEIYRFSNRQIKMGNHIYWDFLSLFEEMKNGIRLAVQKAIMSPVSVLTPGEWISDCWTVQEICWEIPAATVTRIQKGLRKKYSKPCHHPNITGKAAFR